MEWLYISLAILFVLILGGVGFIIDKGRKVARLEDKPTATPRIQRSSGGTATAAPPTTAPPTTTAPPASTAPTPPPPPPAAPGQPATKPLPAQPEVPGAPGSPRATAPTEPTAAPAPLEDVVVPDTPAELVPQLDVPPSTSGRMGRLRERLARSNSAFGRGLLAVIAKDEMTEEDWEDLEDSLLTADVGVSSATHIVEQLRTKSKVVGAAQSDQIRTLLTNELIDALGPDYDRSLQSSRADGSPAVVMIVGVNGTGKTTTCGKLARVLVGDGRTVLMGAADTFRAAAADQLATWGERVGVDVVRGPEQADPASVAFDAVKEGRARGVDTVLIDTAGRLHTKTGLMDELGKVKRVVEKQGAVDETLLVLDATTGQNGVVQAKVFTDVVDVTGIVLTKLDGSAKGGVVISVQKELGVPVKYVGIGEGKDDLAPFDPREFVDGLLATA